METNTEQRDIPDIGRLTKAHKPISTIRRVRPCADRFWEKVERTEGCWIWKASLNTYGYGQFFHDGSPRKAHRLSYEWANGPIPAGLEIDHLCRTRACVNPDHLEPVTHRENLLRGDTFQARNANATHCPRGHAYDYANTKVGPTGGRRCRACDREKHAERKRANPYEEGLRSDFT